MKRYCFITGSVGGIGGAELYMMHKIHWLKRNGWDIVILAAKEIPHDCIVQEFYDYSNGFFPILYCPPFQCTSSTVELSLKKIISRLGKIKIDDEIIIETHTGAMSLWGELIAERIKAKHIINLIDENYNEVTYKEKKDFYIYKFQRGELFGGQYSLEHVFEDKYEYDKNQSKFFLLNESPVDEINDERFNAIEKSDYTICYIGRANKIYVPNIIRSIKVFADNNLNKKLNFIMIGNADCQSDLIKELLAQQQNVQLYLMGDVFPIPRKLFRIVDVVIAGSGSARSSAQENVYTIVADPVNGLSNGLLGYDTQHTLRREDFVHQKSFDESLQDILIDKKYNNMKASVIFEPTPEECCTQNMKLIHESSSDLNYFGKDKICNKKVPFKCGLKGVFACWMPRVYTNLVDTLKKGK